MQRENMDVGVRCDGDLVNAVRLRHERILRIQNELCFELNPNIHLRSFAQMVDYVNRWELLHEMNTQSGRKAFLVYAYNGDYTRYINELIDDLTPLILAYWDIKVTLPISLRLVPSTRPGMNHVIQDYQILTWRQMLIEDYLTNPMEDKVENWRLYLKGMKELCGNNKKKVIQDTLWF